MPERALPPLGEVFDAFDAPHYTQVPDQLFDVLLPYLSEAELKVLLYIIRRTFGFKKDADAISMRQMAEGIVRKDGRRLDYGAGISLRSVQRGVEGLLDKGLIEAAKTHSAGARPETTIYRLRFRRATSDYIADADIDKLAEGLASKSPQQETDESTNRNGSDRAVTMAHEGAVNTLRNELRRRGWPEGAIAAALARYQAAGWPPLPEWLATL